MTDANLLSPMIADEPDFFFPRRRRDNFHPVPVVVDEPDFFFPIRRRDNFHQPAHSYIEKMGRNPLASPPHVSYEQQVTHPYHKILLKEDDSLKIKEISQLICDGVEFPDDIMVFAASTNIDIIKLIIESGFSVKNDKYDEYVMKNAIFKNNPVIIKYLCSQGYVISHRVVIHALFVSTDEIVKYLLSEATIDFDMGFILPDSIMLKRLDPHNI